MLLLRNFVGTSSSANSLFFFLAIGTEGCEAEEHKLVPAEAVPEINIFFYLR